MTDSNSASVEAMIKNVVTVVFRIHFYYVTNYDLEQDLKQEGYLKAYELLAQGNYDPNKNLRTFIYTGVRNAMTNYMYHTNKESHINITFPFIVPDEPEKVYLDKEGNVITNNKEKIEVLKQAEIKRREEIKKGEE